MPDKLYYSYNQLHKLIQETAKPILDSFRPDIIIAIGGGGFIPARILRTFLKRSKTDKNIPIFAIGLVLYDNDDDGKPLDLVTKTQWISAPSNNNPGVLLRGKKILIVDEVDDTRSTLSYAVRELQKDIEREAEANPANDVPETEIGVFVLQNKLKPKHAELPKSIRYFAGEDVDDIWIVYPWESSDIDLHTEMAEA